jgi:hypothetical protein
MQGGEYDLCRGLLCIRQTEILEVRDKRTKALGSAKGKQVIYTNYNIFVSR